MVKNVLVFLFILANTVMRAQPAGYGPANGHSHNDYNQPVPFSMAYQAGMGSIEADIFLYQGALIVAHDESGLAWHKSLKVEYLDKIQKAIQEHGGHPYSDQRLTLQLLIDIKSDSVSTLAALMNLLKKYPVIIGSVQIRIVITGNRPAPSSFTSYPDFISFDGILSEGYSPEALTRIVMFSDNFQKYSRWNGEGLIPTDDRMLLTEKIKLVHSLKKTVRFWNAPDNANAWKQLMELGVDFINTDHVKELSEYLSARPSKS